MDMQQALQMISQWRLPPGESLLERVEAMIEPAILQGAFGPSRTLAVSGMQYHLGGAEDTRQLAALTRVRPADHVLDVCCFVGGPALQLALECGCRMTGIDANPVAIAAAQRIARLTGLESVLCFAQADSAHMPVEPDSIDVVWNQGSFAHDEVWLREFDRVLRPGGRLAMVFQFRPADSPPPDAGDLWTMEETGARVTGLGYRVDHLEDLCEREIEQGWGRLLRRLESRREVYRNAFGAAWVETTRAEFEGEIDRMRRREWSNARLLAIKPEG